MKMNLPYPVRYALNALRRAGYQAYCVGGCVRDSLLGVEPNDFDLTTSALPEETLALFKREHTLTVGLKHGTITLIKHGMPIEITTFRIDGEYEDNRRPEEVTFTSHLEEDVLRRDFTVNALCWNEQEDVVDYVGGVDDLNARIIRCVGDPILRFNEDALRMFRALRFSARLGFTIEYETIAAISECAPLACELAPERVRDELEKILLTTRPETLGVAIKFGLLKRYIPGNGWASPNYADIASMNRKPLTRWVTFSIMLQKYGYIPSAHAFLEELRLDGRTLRCCADAEAMLKCEAPGDKLGWKKLLSRYGVDSVACAVAAYDVINGLNCEKEFKAVLKSGECFSLKHLAVSGDDLLSLGLKGPELGEMLKFLLDYVMEYPDNNKREILLELAKYSEES